MRHATAVPSVHDPSISDNDIQAAREEKAFSSTRAVILDHWQLVHAIAYNNLKRMHLVHNQQADQAQRSTAVTYLRPLQHGRGDKSIEEKSPLHKLPRRSCWGMFLYEGLTESNGQRYQHCDRKR